MSEDEQIPPPTWGEAFRFVLCLMVIAWGIMLLIEGMRGWG